MTTLSSMLRILGLLGAAPPVADALFRMVLVRAGARWPGASAPMEAIGRWLVIVPARGEGAAVAETLRSIADAADGRVVETVLLLDGPDPEAASVGLEHGVRVVLKEPVGPTKGAALAWLTTHHEELLDAAEAVLVLDVGSRVGQDFFHAVTWPGGADAAQAWLRGVGSGVGDAVRLSEAMAQELEDRGRQAMGWNVHLRGTGTAFTPEAFRRIVPALKTAVEDTESTLLLASEGRVTALMGPEAWVEDVKPSRVDLAARQRSRWLLGEISLFFRQPGALIRLLVLHPLEGVAFLAGLLSRPLSLSGLLRVILALCFFFDALRSGSMLSWVAGAVLVSTLLTDLMLLRRAARMPWLRLAGVSLRLGVAWIGAVLLLPRAALGWIRGRR